MKRTVFVAIEADESATPGLVVHDNITRRGWALRYTLTHEPSGRKVGDFISKERAHECARRLGKINWDRPLSEIMKQYNWDRLGKAIKKLVKELDGD